MTPCARGKDVLTTCAKQKAVFVPGLEMLAV